MTRDPSALDVRPIPPAEVFNASRIVKLYGTRACKGQPTPERPHRDSRVIEAPEELRPTPRALLEALAAEAVEAPAQPPPSRRVRDGQGHARQTTSSHADDRLARARLSNAAA